MSGPPNLPPRSPYNERLPGVYGEFGSGSDLRAFYLQTSISPVLLDKISLVKDIQGSERWRVRDLFQREVDDERVTRGLYPYLQAKDKIKFFNSLILTVLPMNASDGSVMAQMPKVVEKSEREGGRDWTVLERDGFFRIRWITGREEYAELEWNGDRSEIVAIDGQHRLSALKRLKRVWSNVQGQRYGDLDAQLGEAPPRISQSFLEWRIPIVIVSFRASEGRREPPSVLEVVRNIFVHINTKAQKVGDARKVLLNDESVNSVAAQELLERAHGNDLRPRGERQPESLPLLFFDWRGLERDGKAVSTPAAVKSVVEIEHWFEYYILGEDFSPDQEAALDVSGGSDLKAAFHKGALDYEASRAVRRKVRKDVLPALSHLIENFEPYRSYIVGLRELEDEYDSGNDFQHHAFDRLRFGSGHEEPVNKFQVDEMEHGLLTEIEKLRLACLRPAMPIDHDIGMRGVVQSFGDLRDRFRYPDWREYAEWFTSSLNVVYAKGWFEAEYPGKAHDYLRHVVLNQNEMVVNYRLQDAQKAFGAYISLLVGSCAMPLAGWEVDWPLIENELLSDLGVTVLRGYKKEVRPELVEEHPNRGRELIEAVRREAEKRAGRQMRRFERELERLAAP